MKRTLTIAKSALITSLESADVSFVPPIARRRLSPLQKIFFALAHATDATEGAVVFASRDGEDTLTRRLVDDFHADGSVSPNRFSSSVYNAAPGLWSIRSANRAPYTAIAGGDETVECGLLESLGASPLLYVVAEETFGGRGAAVLFSDLRVGRRIELTDGVKGAQPISLAAWMDFLAGRSAEIIGPILTIREVR